MGDSSGYKYICGYKGHPMANKFGAIYEHRLVMSQKLERFLTSNELVHHKNEDKSDNKPENLELKTNKTHPKHHAKPAKFIKLECAYCKKSFSKKYHQVTTKIKYGQKDFYCNKECMYLAFKRKKN